MSRSDMTLVCQSCGRKFQITQDELDNFLSSSISMPMFCSLKCNLSGWNPYAVYMEKMKRAREDDKVKKA